VGKSPIGNQFGPYSPDRASSWPVGLFGSGRHGFPVARVSKAQRSEWLPGTTEGGSCTPPQHSTRHVTSGTIPHHTPVAWRGSALLRVIRPWPVTQDWTGRTSQATGRNGRAGETEANPGCVSVTIGRARHALRNSARLSPLRNKLDASLPAAQGKLPSRVGILSPAKAGVATKVRLEAQAFRRTTAIESFPARKNQNDIRCILGTWQVVGILVAAQRSIAHSRFGSATQMTTAGWLPST
jgi:hypothetical protein